MPLFFRNYQHKLAQNHKTRSVLFLKREKWDQGMHKVPTSCFTNVVCEADLILSAIGEFDCLSPESLSTNSNDRIWTGLGCLINRCNSENDSACWAYQTFLMVVGVNSASNWNMLCELPYHMQQKKLHFLSGSGNPHPSIGWLLHPANAPGPRGTILKGMSEWWSWYEGLMQCTYGRKAGFDMLQASDLQGCSRSANAFRREKNMKIS